MNILAIDTAASLCAACIRDVSGGVELGRSVRDIGKGHAELLMDVIGEALAGAKLTYAGVGAVAVSVGPGSFTGIRVGVATARGLALAAGIPSVGVSTLEALALQTRDRFGAVDVMSAIDGGRDGIYVALYDGFGNTRHDARVTDLATVVGLSGMAAVVAGSAAPRVLDAAGGNRLRCGIVAATADIAVFARLAESRIGIAGKPQPLYLRAPDAKPQAHLALSRREG